MAALPCPAGFRHRFSPPMATSSPVGLAADSDTLAGASDAIDAVGRRTSRRNPTIPPANAIAAITVQARW